MLHDPSYDAIFIGLKSVATNGGEHGPFYDEGVLHVIEQIELTGTFTPSPLRAIGLLKSAPQILTVKEKAELNKELAVRGWSLENGAYYANGIAAAETLLSRYKLSDV